MHRKSNLLEIATNTLLFLLHVIVGTIGVSVEASLLRYSVVASLPSLTRTAEWISLETPYFPIQILVGLLCGFLLGRRFKHRVMLWIWTVPALCIVVMILFVPLRPVIVSGVELTKTEHFFGWGCLPRNHCFYQMPITLMLYAALAYSVGAFAARRLPSPSKPQVG